MDSGLSRRSPSLTALLWTCFVIGATSFGGGLNAYVRKVFVQRRGWVSEEEFLEAMEVSRALPGPNVINLVVMLARTLRGPAGALMGLCGLVLPAIAANALLVMLLLAREQGPALTAVLAGFGAAGAGLSVANAVEMGRLHIRWLPDIVLTAVATVTTIAVKPPLLVVLLVFGGAGIALHLVQDRRTEASA